MHTWQLALSLNIIFVRCVYATICTHIHIFSLLYGILLYKYTLTYLSALLLMNIQVVLYTTEYIDEHPCTHLLVDTWVSTSQGSCWVLRWMLILTLAGYCQVALFIWILIWQMFTKHLLCVQPWCNNKAIRVTSSKIRSREKGLKSARKNLGGGSRQLPAI